ncbi:forkhead box protein O6 [Bombina bombina]|uniref:forkhead box protein O6 n=1 Tax=Bombina bombina TaxID=8345 RepID=UPI00235A5C99|nr:forkhead box protein O6 [Bombina bombina]
MEKLEAETDVEPQVRPRSCTWPPLPEPPSDMPLPPPGMDPGQMRKAKSSRRNAWGNLSYADLITKAIESSPERRLTLSQIYDWMVRFVPYFKDKGDSNSSAGWKNSIRHNLSLHTRFIRVQNEGTGKSSWWMLNPEGGKTGKTPRRRAASMDSTGGKFLRIKGKAGKKKQQQVQTAPDQTNEGSPSSQHAKWSESPSSHTSDDFEVWADFHNRSNTTVGSVSGRLSPIMSNQEPDDLDDDEVAPSSPLMYPSPSSALSPSARCSVEMPRLAELTGTIGLGDGLADHLMDELQDGYSVTSGTALRQRSPGFSFSSKCPSLSPPSGTYCGSIYSQPAIGMMRRLPMQTIQENKQAAFSSGSTYRNSSIQDLLSTMTYGHKEGTAQGETGLSPVVGAQRNHRQNSGMLSSCDSGLVPYSTNLMKNHSLYHPSTLNHHCSVNNSALANAGGLVNSESCGLASSQHHSYFSNQGGHGSLLEAPYQGMYHHHHHHHHPQVYNQDRFPADLDLDMFNGTLECDVESIILNDFMDNDEMDFNFDSALPPQGGFTMAAAPQPVNHSWVQG